MPVSEPSDPLLSPLLALSTLTAPLVRRERFCCERLEEGPELGGMTCRERVGQPAWGRQVHDLAVWGPVQMTPRLLMAEGVEDFLWPHNIARKNCPCRMERGAGARLGGGGDRQRNLGGRGVNLWLRRRLNSLWWKLLLSPIWKEIVWSAELIRVQRRLGAIAVRR